MATTSAMPPRPIPDRRAGCASASTGSSRASASARSSTGSRPRRGWAGHVRNDERGVLIEVEGPRRELDRFLARLASEAPPLARVERITEPGARAAGGERVRDRGEQRVGGRRRRSSPPTRRRARSASAEVLDPADRRHRYPFTNCTNCGPRFTIVTGRPLRPAADDDGRVRDVRRLPGRVRGSARPPLPCAAQRVSRLRPASRGCSSSEDRSEAVEQEAGDAVEATAAALLAGSDRRGQGDRRLPPRLPGGRRGGGRRAALAQASRGQAVRGDGADLEARADPGRADPGRGGAADRPRGVRS